MKPSIDLVREFHVAFDRPVRDTPDVGAPAERVLCVRLMLEEVLEFAKAAGIGVSTKDEGVEIDRLNDLDVYSIAFGTPPNLVAMAHELADVAYVTHGTAVQFGIPLLPVVAEVHAANMRKLSPDGKPIVDERGKVLKPAGWRPADVAQVLAGKSHPAPETECIRRADGIHCEHWQDGASCCDCGAPADPEVCQKCGAADGHAPTCESLGSPCQKPGCIHNGPCPLPSEQTPECETCPDRADFERLCCKGGAGATVTDPEGLLDE